MQRALPGLSAMHLARDQLPMISVNGRLTMDATRELARCANGELVSHEVVRDGIDALLQLKRASFDATPNGHPLPVWREGDALRTAPERRPSHVPCPPPLLGPRGGVVGTAWTECLHKEESSDDDEENGQDNDSSDSESNTPPPEQRHRPPHQPRRKKQRTVSDRRYNAPTSNSVTTTSTKKTVKPPVQQNGNRPPTIWHRRRKDPPTNALATPKSPKSDPSPLPSADPSDIEDTHSDNDELVEASGPAVLHFSCLQCHRAKKRCNRTRPCSRCVIRGMQHECRYPDKHDPRSVLRACLRCWQTKKKCDRKQPSCGKCDKVGVKCIYRRELQQGENPESPFQVPTPSLTLSPPPPASRASRVPSDASMKTLSPPSPPPTSLPSKKRKLTDPSESVSSAKRPNSENNNYNDADHPYSTRRRDTRTSSTTKSDELEPMKAEEEEVVVVGDKVNLAIPETSGLSGRILRSRK